MKGICHTRSRGRHFSPSLPGDRYLKLGSKSDHRVEISGNIVGYDALAPRPEVLRSFSCFYANSGTSYNSCVRTKFLEVTSQKIAFVSVFFVCSCHHRKGTPWVFSVLPQVVCLLSSLFCYIFLAQLHHSRGIIIKNTTRDSACKIRQKLQALYTTQHTSKNGRNFVTCVASDLTPVQKDTRPYAFLAL